MMRATSNGFLLMMNALAASISSRTPAPQYASPRPDEPSSVVTRTRIQSKFPLITAVSTAAIRTPIPPLVRQVICHRFPDA
jgi:hypothetical protein